MKDILKNAMKFRRSAGPVKRLATDCEGATIIEFALLAAPFFFTVFSIFEAALFLASQLVIDNVRDEAQRLYLTGQAQTASMTNTEVLEKACSRAFMPLKCSDITLETKSFPNLTSITVGSNGIRSSGTTGVIGTGSEIMEIKLSYTMSCVTNYLMCNSDSGNIDINTRTVFKVEPYDT